MTMDPTSNTPPPLSQASSPFAVEPLPASLLVERELDRREKLLRKGNLMTGCTELDDYVLLGGLERGRIVGVSAEEEDMGLVIGLQTAAVLLATNISAKAMVVTTLPASVLLPKLRKALVDQLSSLQDGLQDLQKRVQGCLERISIARVFDMEGLWEVLRELEAAVSLTDNGLPQADQKTKGEQRQGDTLPAERTPNQRGQRTEILDSEDEGGLSSPESPVSQEPPAQADDIPSTSQPNPQETGPATLPDLILITHTSTLLNALFTGRDKEAAHNTMLLLSSRLHSLTRSPPHGGPLIMFLNSTTSPSSSSSYSTHHTDPGPTAPPTDRQNHVEPTLRSIFNIPPPTVAGHQQVVQNFTPARRTKPSFGLVFSQMLDLHLLCTRVPRTRADNTALMNPGAVVAGVSYVWVVEVLLDEIGVYARSDEGWDWGERRCREQRWGAVDVDSEGRVVGAVLP